MLVKDPESSEGRLLEWHAGDWMRISLLAACSEDAGQTTEGLCIMAWIEDSGKMKTVFLKLIPFQIPLHPRLTMLNHSTDPLKLSLRFFRHSILMIVTAMIAANKAPPFCRSANYCNCKWQIQHLFSWNTRKLFHGNLYYWHFMLWHLYIVLWSCAWLCNAQIIRAAIFIFAHVYR